MTDYEQVRFYVGDTSELLTVDEIDFALSEAGDVIGAAVLCADVLAARFAQKADRTIGDLSISFSQISKGYAATADSLRARQASFSSFGAPYAGGISLSDKTIDEQNPDMVGSSFKRGMHDSPGNRYRKRVD